MKNHLLIIISILFIGCCGKPNFTDNGLNGKIKSINEYNISVKFDSLNNHILDTLSRVVKQYNELNQIIARTETFFIDDETLNISFKYNSCDQLEKEIVKMSEDSMPMVVNYLYENSLIKETTSEFVRDSIYFKQTVLNKYDSNKKLIESTLSHIVIDLQNNDTITNSLQIDKYGQNDLLKEIVFKSYTNPIKNYSSKYFYKENELIEIRNYHRSDSLIGTTRFEYKYDSLENWIERKSFKNNNLKLIRRRAIIYK